MQCKRKLNNIIFNRYLLHLTINLVYKIIARHNLYIYTSSCMLHSLCVIFFLHINTQMKFFVDLTAFDFPEKKYRLHFSYNLFSLLYNRRIMINGATTGILFSISNIFISSNWSERECWDLFGILFLNHPDLRRILTDYGFHGYPMRKDFPLVGFSELRFDSKRKAVSYSNVQLIQEFRFFFHDTTWKFY